jgi:hypothetical protein
MSPRGTKIWGGIWPTLIMVAYFIVGLVGGLANNARIAAIEPKSPGPVPAMRRPESSR